MFALSAATKVYLAAGATDLRKGFEGLCALVEGVLEEAPLSGHVFLFANGARTRLKGKRLSSPCWRQRRWRKRRRLEGGSRSRSASPRLSGGRRGAKQLVGLSGGAARRRVSARAPRRWCRWLGVGGRRRGTPWD